MQTKTTIKQICARMILAFCASLAATGTTPATRADVVTDWNQIALATQNAIPGTTVGAPGGVFRSFESFSQAAHENMNSRVWLGVHFRSACRDGLKQGKRVANCVVHHFLRPVKKHHHPREVDEQ